MVEHTDTTQIQTAAIEGGLRLKSQRKQSYPGKPLVTVVTVVRNCAPQLKKTMESVCTQTYENIEYIVIDGASTDGSLDVIKQYEHRVDYWISAKDHGVYDAMNKAIDLAGGDWINFMNAGDWFYQPDVIETVFSDYPEDAQMVFGDYYFLFADGKMVPVKAKPLDTLWQRMTFSHQSLFARRQLMVENKFSANFRSASDYYFIIKAYSEKKKFFYSKNFICVYADSGITVKHRLRSMIERWRIARKYGGISKFEIDKFHLSLIWQHISTVLFRRFWKK